MTEHSREYYLAQINAYNAQKQELEESLNAAKAQKAAFLRTMKAGISSAEGVVAHAKSKLKEAQGERDPGRKAQLIKLNEFRLAAASNYLESLNLVQSIDVERGPSPAFQQTLELLNLKGQYLLTEYNLANYAPVLGLLEEALGIRKTASPEAAAEPVQRAATGPLGRPGLPPRPGLPQRPGTAPLPPRPGVPAVPGASRPPAPIRPSAPGRPLNMPLMPMRPGTDNLKQEAREADTTLGSDLKEAVLDEETKNKLKDLLIRVRDLDMSLGLLRGETPGEMAAELGDLAQQIRQIAGKVYYVNRVLTTLGGLGQRMKWCSDGHDPDVEKILASGPTSMDGAAARPAPAGGQVALAGRLRSLHKG